MGLDIDDVRLSARKGALVVRYGKGDHYREVPVHPELRQDLAIWLEERPDWRGTLTGLYSVSRFHALARASYYGKFSSAQPGFCDLCRERYGSKTLIDAEMGYRFGQVDLSIGVRNLFDVYPDQPSSTVIVDAPGTDTSRDFNNNFGTFPWAAASPFGYNGRYIYTRASIPLSQ